MTLAGWQGEHPTRERVGITAYSAFQGAFFKQNQAEDNSYAVLTGAVLTGLRFLIFD